MIDITIVWIYRFFLCNNILLYLALYFPVLPASSSSLHPFLSHPFSSSFSQILLKTIHRQPLPHSFSLLMPSSFLCHLFSLIAPHPTVSQSPFSLCSLFPSRDLLLYIFITPDPDLPLFISFNPFSAFRTPAPKHMHQKSSWVLLRFVTPNPFLLNKICLN